MNNTDSLLTLRLLSHRVFLAWILKYCVPAFSGMRIEDIMDRCFATVPIVQARRGDYSIRFTTGVSCPAHVYLNLIPDPGFAPDETFIMKSCLDACARTLENSDTLPTYSIHLLLNPASAYQNTYRQMDALSAAVNAGTDARSLMARLRILCAGSIDDPSLEDDECGPLLGLLDILLDAYMPLPRKRYILRQEYNLYLEDTMVQILYKLQKSDQSCGSIACL